MADMLPPLPPSPSARNPKDAPTLDDSTDLFQYETALKWWYEREASRGHVTSVDWFLFAAAGIKLGTIRFDQVDRYLKNNQSFRSLNQYIEYLFECDGQNSEVVMDNCMKVMQKQRLPGQKVAEYTRTFDKAKISHARYARPKWPSATYAQMLFTGVNVGGYLKSELRRIKQSASDDTKYEAMFKELNNPDSDFAALHELEKKGQYHYQSENFGRDFGGGISGVGNENSGAIVDSDSYFGRPFPSRDGRDNPRNKDFRSKNTKIGVETGSLKKQGDPGINRGLKPRGQKVKFSDASCFKCGLYGHIKPNCVIDDDYADLFRLLYRSLSELRSKPTMDQAARAFYQAPEKFIPNGFTLPTNNKPGLENVFDFYFEGLPNEPFMSAIADTGSPKSVCGFPWLKEFCRIYKLQMPALRSSQRQVRFGANEDAETILGVTNIDLVFKTKHGEYFTKSVEVDVAERDLPLLISKHDLEKWRVNILCGTGEFDFGGGKIVETLPIDQHFHLPLMHADGSIYSYFTKAELSKLHLQFNHRSPSEMRRILRIVKPDISDAELAEYDTISELCHICLKYARPDLKPIVAAPHADQPGDCFHLDIGTIEGEQVLLVVDEFSNLKVPVYLGPKPDTSTFMAAIKELFIGSILGMGIPKTIFLDQESSFVSEETMNFLSSLGVKDIRVISRNGHFSNGVVETAITNLRRFTLKAMEERKLSVRDALPIAAFVVNTHLDKAGFTPLLLWNGRKVIVPGDVDDDHPVLRLPDDSDINSENGKIWKYLQDLQNQRHAHFTEICTQRVQRALRSITRTPTDLSALRQGQKVYVYRDGKNQKLGVFEGPFPFLGSDGAGNAIVFSGTKIMLSHPSRLLPSNDYGAIKLHSQMIPRTAKELQKPLESQHVDALGDHTDLNNDTSSKLNHDPRPDGQRDVLNIPVENTSVPRYQEFSNERNIMVGNVQQLVPLSDGPQDEKSELSALQGSATEPTSREAEPGILDGPDRSNSPIQPTPLASFSPPSTAITSKDHEPENPEEAQDENEVIDLIPAASEPATLSSKRDHSEIDELNNPVVRRSKRNKTQVDYRALHSGATKRKHEVIVSEEISESAKVANKSARTFFHHPTQPRLSDVIRYFIQHSNIRTQPVPYDAAITDPDFVLAMQAEIQSFYDTKSVIDVPRSSVPATAHILSTRWVLTEKHSLDSAEIRKKARLTVRGFEDPFRKQIVSYAPTMAKASLRTLAFVAAQNRWAPRSLDFTTAFLQGDTIDREVFLQPPSDFVGGDTVWRATKSIYGMNSAPAAWYDKVRSVFTQHGFRESVWDPCVFWLHDNRGLLQGFIGIHVDDSFLAGNTVFDKCLRSIQSVLKCRDEKSFNFDYCGVSVTTRDKTIIFNQDMYASSIYPMDLPSSHELVDRTKYRAVVGQLLYLAGNTRPDLAFATSVAARSNNSPNVEAVQAVNEIVKSVSRKENKLVYQAVSSPRVLVMSDASWANVEGGASQGGFIVLITDETKENIGGWIHFKSQKLRRVARSSTTAETLALTEAIDAALWVKGLLCEAHVVDWDDPVSAYIDCNDVFQIARTRNIPLEKRLMMNIHAIREDLESGQLELHWIPTTFNIADVMTKHKASLFNFDLAIRNNKLLKKQYAAQMKHIDASALVWYTSDIRESPDAGEYDEEEEKEKNSCEDHACAGDTDGYKTQHPERQQPPQGAVTKCLVQCTEQHEIARLYMPEHPRWAHV